jgi:hypothetical protein
VVSKVSSALYLGGQPIVGYGEIRGISAFSSVVGH